VRRYYVGLDARALHAEIVRSIHALLPVDMVQMVSSLPQLVRQMLTSMLQARKAKAPVSIDFLTAPRVVRWRPIRPTNRLQMIKARPAMIR
jgi:hypothetical protein